MDFSKVELELLQKAKMYKKKIVLPESTDKRVLNAVSYITNNDICDIILIGKKEDIVKKIKEYSVDLDINKIKIVDNLTDNKRQEYINTLYELRKNKNVDYETAKRLLEDETYYAAMMVYKHDADGMVSGAIHSTADTLRPALQIVKTKENIKSVSSFFLMNTKKKQYGQEGTFIFADCGLSPNPTSEQLKDIAISSANSFKLLLNKEPKVAFLSYSTYGSAKGEEIDKIKNAIKLLEEENVDFDFDGELQLDAALEKDVAALKAPSSKIAGQANILIFPNLDAGNIGYKLVQRFSDAVALGPITQGLKYPVNDLSRGCKTQDIIGVIAITCIQAFNN